MINQSDSDYLETKEIVLGQQSVHPRYQRLIDWIELTYQRRPINIYVDRVGPCWETRLSVIFCTEAEVGTFEDDLGINFNKSIQASIAAEHERLEPWYAKFSLRQKRDALVIFTSFEKVARCDVFDQVKEDALLGAVLKVFHDIWCVKKMLSYPIIFFETDREIKGLDSGKKAEVRDAVGSLIADLDFCGCFADDVFIGFDSKENFEKSYQSNWFYYSRDH